MGKALIALAAIFWIGASAARADAPAPIPQATNAMTPAEAAQAIDVLQDPAKRAALIGTFRSSRKPRRRPSRQPDAGAADALAFADICGPDPAARQPRRATRRPGVPVCSGVL